MKEQSNGFKAKIVEFKQSIQEKLQMVLDEDNLLELDNSFNKAKGFYQILPEDNAVLKNCKLLFNILASLEQLADSLWNLTAINELKESLLKMDLRTFNGLQGLFKDLYDKCPNLFNLVQQGCLNGVGQISPTNTSFIKNLMEGVYNSLSKPPVIAEQTTEKSTAEENNFLEATFKYLQDMEQGVVVDTAEKAVEENKQTNPTNQLLTGIQTAILQAVDESFSDSEKNSFNLTEKGLYIIEQNDSAMISNIKNVLNGLNGLAKACHSWNNWNNAGTLQTLAQIYAQIRTLMNAYYQLISASSKTAVAGNINQVLKEAIGSMNDLMREFAIYLTQIEVKLGIKTGYLFEQMSAVFDNYQYLAQLAKVQFLGKERYPYYMARIAALEKEKSSANKKLLLLSFQEKDLIEAKEIFTKYGTAPLEYYSVEDLTLLKTNIKSFNLTESDQKEYLKQLDQALDEKKQQKLHEQDGNQGYLGGLNNMLWMGVKMVKQKAEQVNNYLGTTLQSLVVEQIDKELASIKNATKVATFDIKVANSHLRVLEKEYQGKMRGAFQEVLVENKRVVELKESIEKLNQVSAPVANNDQSREKTTENPKMIASFLKFVRNIFAKIIDAVTNKISRKDNVAPTIKTDVAVQPVFNAQIQNQVTNDLSVFKERLTLKPIKAMKKIKFGLLSGNKKTSDDRAVTKKKPIVAPSA